MGIYIEYYTFMTAENFEIQFVPRYRINIIIIIFQYIIQKPNRNSQEAVD